MEHEVSHSCTCKSVSDLRTSSTREGGKMQDNTLGEPISRKKDHGKGQDGGRKLPIKGIHSLPH